MRSLIARLIFSGLIGAAIAGCGTSGSSLPAGGVQNDAGAGSGTNVTVSASSATPPPFSIPPVLLDSGSEGLSAATPTPTPVTWKEVLTNGPASTETQSPLYSTSDTLPATAPAGSPTYPPQSFAGSHLVTFAGSGTSQVILQIQKTLPDLVYTYKSTNPGNNAITAYTYSTIVAHLTYIGAATAPVGRALARIWSTKALNCTTPRLMKTGKKLWTMVRTCSERKVAFHCSGRSSFSTDGI